MPSELNSTVASQHGSDQQSPTTESSRRGPEQIQAPDPQTLHQRATLMLSQLSTSLKDTGLDLQAVKPWQQLAVELDCRLRDLHSLDEV